MVNSFIGQITYIEIENPDLRNINKIDFSNPTGNAYEMGLMPHDANLLIDILDKVVIAISSDTATNNYLIDPGIKKLITG